MRCYTRVSGTEREEISRHLAAGASGRAIARQLGRSPSTISRELCRRAVLTSSKPEASWVVSLRRAKEGAGRARLMLKKSTTRRGIKLSDFTAATPL